jgi:hypothetical protein
MLESAQFSDTLAVMTAFNVEGDMQMEMASEVEMHKNIFIDNDLELFVLSFFFFLNLNL